MSRCSSLRYRRRRRRRGRHHRLHRRRRRRRRRDRSPCVHAAIVSLSLSSASSTSLLSLIIIVLRLSFTGGFVVLLVWWYRGCETPSVRAVQLAWSSDPVTRPAKGVGGTFCRAEGESKRASERRSEKTRRGIL